MIGATVRRERRWTSAGETAARKLVRSTRWQSKSVVSQRRKAQFSEEFCCGQPGGTSPLKGVLSDACLEQLFQLWKPEKLARTSYS
jgi:hypothetical protein